MSLADFQTSAQNVVSAINGLAQAYLNIQGAQNRADIVAATLLRAAPGRLARVSVTVAGSAVGAIYDTNLLTNLINKVYVIPMTVGVIEVNLPMNFGIVVAPGSGQTVVVSYSGELVT